MSVREFACDVSGRLKSTASSEPSTSTVEEVAVDFSLKEIIQ